MFVSVGESNEDFDENYNSMFRDSLGGPPATPTYEQRHKLYTERKEKEMPDGTTQFLGHLVRTTSQLAPRAVRLGRR